MNPLDDHTNHQTTTVKENDMITTLKPFAVSDLLRESHKAGLITARERDRAGKVWAKGGPLKIRRNEWIITVTVEALNCDCGKGLMCPANEWSRA
jgi:hypothetical protein